MSTKNKLISAMAVTLIVAVALSPLSAATLSTYFGSAIASGSAPYAGATLTGVVEYAVFTESAYEGLFPGFNVPNGQLAYVYQILNGNLDPVSQNAVVGINNSVTGIGDNTIDGGAGEKAPQTDMLTPGVSAVWDFSGIGNNVPSNGRSNGLILTSTNLPGPPTTLNILVDGGGSALTFVIAPGDTPVPEPATIMLFGLGLSAVVLSRRRA